MRRQCRMRSTQNPALLRAFAAEIKARRGAKQVSQDELAYRCGLSRTFLGKIEIARNQPSLTALFKLAEGLEVSPDELLKSVKTRLRREQQAAARLAR
jgi:transcriptional regulator with XRE-family HTH domain